MQHIHYSISINLSSQFERVRNRTNETMSKSEVKLIGKWASPFVMRPRIALNIKNIDYQFLEEIFGSKSELLLNSNPVHKKIPVLIHSDKPICESLIIVEYIDEVWSSGPTILPSDPFDRAVVRFWTAYVDEKLFPNMKAIHTTSPEDEARKQAISEVQESMEVLEDAYNKLSKAKPFFGGDKIGFVDIALGSSLGWLRVSEKIFGLKFLDESKTPGLVDWAESFCCDAAVKPVMPETDKLVEYAKLLQGNLK